MANDCIPYVEDGLRVTCDAASAITGKRFVKITANREAGPALNTGTAGGNIRVGPATAAGAAFGVAGWDAATDEKVTVIRGGICPVTATGAIAAGAEVEVAANGTVSAFSAGIKVGMAVTAASDGTDAQILVYQ